MIISQPCDLPEPELSSQQADLLIRQHIGQRVAVDHLLAERELGLRHPGAGSLAIGKNIESACNQLEKQFRTKSAPVENDCNPALADHGADLFENDGEHFDHACVGLGGDDEYRITGHIVDPIVGCSRHCQTPARDVSLRKGPFAVVNADVAVNIEKTHSGAAIFNAFLGQGGSRSAARPKAAKRLSFRRKVLTSGARSSPRTLPRSSGECSFKDSGRLIRSSAINSKVMNVVRSP